MSARAAKAAQTRSSQRSIFNARRATRNHGQLFDITQKTFNEIEDYIRDLEAVGRRAPMAIDALVQLMARTDRAYSQAQSRGPVDPQQTNSAAAWKIPVRRITSRYYQGWKLQRVARGVWRVYNDSREAWFIEYGIHPSGQGIARPIRKRALLYTLHYVDRTRAGERVWEYIYGPLRTYSGRGARGQLPRQRAASFA